ncbi:hypothetical protein C8R47DRAFT_165453 [Mycena vitilis]|nr:hypothetical protein C8R47DRAFT_165453 [Mycena vitilis]
MYNDTTQRVPASERVQTLDLPTALPVVILGDTNLHHEKWSRVGINGDTKANSFVDWTTEKGYTLLNKKGEVTYIPHGRHGSPSVIDLTHVNAAAVNNDTVQEWAIDGTMSYGSDHKGIRWVQNYGRREIENIAGIKYSLKEVEPGDWQQAFREALGTHRAQIEPIMDDNTPVSNDQLESAAGAITQAMKDATVKVGKERRPNANAKPWWNAELKEAANNLTLRSKVKKAANFFKRLCKATKAKWAIGKLEEAHTEDIWGFPPSCITQRQM